MPDVTLRIQQEASPIVAEMGTTILAAALQAGLPFRHSCQSGNCASCKCELISGDVMELPYSEFALSPEERADGHILACRTTMWGDTEIAYLRDIMAHPMRDLTCRVVSKERVTHDVAVVRMEIVDGGPYTFEAGQFATLTFANGLTRDFSMANRPGEEVLEFHIRKIPGGGVSPYVHDSLEVGTDVQARGPLGSAWWRPSHDGPIVAIAGSTGLAPMQSIAETALTLGGSEKPFYLYFGVREQRDLYHTDRFDALAGEHACFRFSPVLSEVTSHKRHRTGFVTDAVRADHKSLKGAKLYLAGPPPMIKAAVTLAQELGADRRDCHADVFFTPEAP
jgi:CDP-4-dehydro-6-deoxyglucose reductase/ferredoxin-NAD(P)+ reductase (naphthalene dioxygenase ferredoxin-specific)